MGAGGASAGDALAAAWAILFPSPCVGCGAGERVLCPACGAQLRPEPLTRRLPGGLEVRSGLVYDGVARRAILAVKERGRTVLADELAPALRAALASWPDAEPCPVPSSAGGRRRRGFDPLAIVLARCGVRPVLLLAARAGSVAQKTLGATERSDNRAGAFLAAPAAAGRRIVLVDDVVTTGATLESAARALRDAGAVVVGAATIAATPRHSPVRGRHPDDRGGPGGRGGRGGDS